MHKSHIAQLLKLCNIQYMGNCTYSSPKLYFLLLFVHYVIQQGPLPWILGLTYLHLPHPINNRRHICTFTTQGNPHDTPYNQMVVLLDADTFPWSTTLFTQSPRAWFLSCQCIFKTVHICQAKGWQVELLIVLTLENERGVYNHVHTTLSDLLRNPIIHTLQTMMHLSAIRSIMVIILNKHKIESQNCTI